MPVQNQRETGGRVLRPKDRPDANEDVSQQAAENRKPRGLGNTEPTSDHNENTRHYDGQRPKRS
jgi:hypothetical protein